MALKRTAEPLLEVTVGTHVTFAHVQVVPTTLDPGMLGPVLVHAAHPALQ